MLVIITPTGARPEAFKKCCEYMRAQDYAGRIKWIIVDDCIPTMPTPKVDGWEIIHVHPEPAWKPGQNTQARNLLFGLDYVGPDDLLVIAEDDDSYAPWWLSKCAEWLEHDDLVGEAPSLYRHLNGREKWMNNKNHASLCATAMKGPAIDDFRRVLNEGNTYIDIRLWKRGGKLYPCDGGVIGVKGWPGRPGIGIGHKL